MDRKREQTRQCTGWIVGFDALLNDASACWYELNRSMHLRIHHARCSVGTVAICFELESLYFGMVLSRPPPGLNR